MSREPPIPARVDAFADAVREVREGGSARQYLAGWHRLQRTRATRGSVVDENRSRWWPRRALQLAFALVAVLGPLGWLVTKRVAPQPLQYVVSGASGGIGSRGVAGGMISAPTGRVELLFNDGSRIGMRSGARVTVAALRLAGSEIRLHDGTVDVDVRHQSGTAWTFDAGPYAVQIKGTSFALGWDAARKRLDLRMRSGSVAVGGPVGTPPLTVGAGQSVLLDGVGQRLDRAALDDAPPVDAPAVATTPQAVPQAVRDTSAVSHAERERDRRSPERRSRPWVGHAEWAPLLARGDFDRIVEQASKSGVGACLAADTEQNLATLADAARYTHRRALARRSLMALRARFPESDRARDAAFFLARMSETSSAGDARAALTWYERYLREAASGSYAEEALGRAMIILRRNGGGPRARAVAGRYLEAYPHGVYAVDAAGLLEEHAVP